MTDPDRLTDPRTIINQADRLWDIMVATALGQNYRPGPYGRNRLTDPGTDLADKPRNRQTDLRTERDQRPWDWIKDRGTI